MTSNNVESGLTEPKSPDEELAEKVAALDDINSDIGEIERNQEAALKEYDGFPDTVTLFGKEMDIPSVLRSDLLSNLAVNIFEDIPEAMAAIDTFLGLEEERDNLEYDAMILQNEIKVLEANRYDPGPDPGSGSGPGMNM